MATPGEQVPLAEAAEKLVKLVFTAPRLTQSGVERLVKVIDAAYDRKPFYKSIGVVPGQLDSDCSPCVVLLGGEEKTVSLACEEKIYSAPGSERFFDDLKVMTNLAYRFGIPREQLVRGTSDTFLLPLLSDIGGDRTESLILKSSFHDGRAAQEVKRRILGSVGLGEIGRESYLNVVAFSLLMPWSLELYRQNLTSRLLLQSQDSAIWEAELNTDLDLMCEYGLSEESVLKPENNGGIVNHALDAIDCDLLTFHWYAQQEKIRDVAPGWAQKKQTQLRKIYDLATNVLKPDTPVTLFLQDCKPDHFISRDASRKMKFAYDQGPYEIVLQMNKVLNDPKNSGYYELLHKFRHGELIPSEIMDIVKSTPITPRDALKGMYLNMFVSLGQYAAELSADKEIDRRAVDHFVHIIGKSAYNHHVGNTDISHIWPDDKSDKSREMKNTAEKIFFANYGVMRYLLFKTIFKQDLTLDDILVRVINDTEDNKLSINFNLT